MLVPQRLCIDIVCKALHKRPHLRAPKHRDPDREVLKELDLFRMKMENVTPNDPPRGLLFSLDGEQGVIVDNQNF